MTVEIYLRKPPSDEPMPAKEDDLPDSLMELEMALQELSWTFEKLKESTDLLTEEFRCAEGEEAREYYGYVQDNLEIMRAKAERMERIKNKINQIKGIFPTVFHDQDSSESSGAGGLMDGHLL
jgi:hypothetical protein